MKYSLCLLGSVVALSLTSPAAPLQKNQIAADAKWLVHVDLDGLRSTQLGKLLTRHLAHLAKVETPVKVDFAALFQKIGHITAYGDQFDETPDANGVLLVKLDLETRQIVEGFIAAQMLAAKDESIKKAERNSIVTYSLKDELFLDLLPDHIAVLGKSRARLDKARDVLAGKSSGLPSSHAFADFPAAPDTFFFLAVAEAFNGNSAVPPQAKILQMADGGRLVLGEKADKLFVEVILKAKSAEVITQIQQVIQGTMALVSLSQMENQEVQQLMRSTKVSTEKNMVMIKIDYPAATVLEKLSQELNQHGPKKDRPKSEKLEREAKSKPPANSNPE